MNNIADLLKDATQGYYQAFLREGFKLYSPLCGDVYLSRILDNGDLTVFVDEEIGFFTFNSYGQYNINGECLLFPSKEVRNWDNFSLKKKEKYHFKPFDKVVVRDNKLDTWTIDFFSYKDKSCKEAPYTTINGWYTYCLPYNEKTAKLIGTTDDYIE